jgi:hypothetical protein
VREDECGNPHNEKQTQLIASKKRDKETRQQEQGEPTEQKYSADKSPLLPDGGENVVVVHSSSWKEPKFDLRVWRFEPLARPTA